MRGNLCQNELRRRGIHPAWLVPPAFRVAWAAGIEVSPPFYWSVTARTLFLGVPVAVLTFAIVVGLDAFVRQFLLSAKFYLALSAFFGLLAPLAYSLIVRLHRGKLAAMPPWDSLG